MCVEVAEGVEGVLHHLVHLNLRQHGKTLLLLLLLLLLMGPARPEAKTIEGVAKREVQAARPSALGRTRPDAPGW